MAHEALLMFRFCSGDLYGVRVQQRGGPSSQMGFCNTMQLRQDAIPRAFEKNVLLNLPGSISGSEPKHRVAELP